MTSSYFIKHRRENDIHPVCKEDHHIGDFSLQKAQRFVQQSRINEGDKGDEDELLVLHYLKVYLFGQNSVEYFGAVQRGYGQEVEHAQRYVYHSDVQENIADYDKCFTEADISQAVHYPAHYHCKERHNKVGGRACQRGEHHALAGIFEVIGIYIYGLAPAEADEHHHNRAPEGQVLEGVEGYTSLIFAVSSPIL